MTIEDAIEELKLAKEFLNITMMKEAIDVAIVFMSKLKISGWHDLIENPDDLPKRGEDVLLLTKRYGVIVSAYCGDIWTEHDMELDTEVCKVNSGEALAWKPIDTM